MKSCCFPGAVTETSSFSQVVRRVGSVVHVCIGHARTDAWFSLKLNARTSETLAFMRACLCMLALKTAGLFSAAEWLGGVGQAYSGMMGQST